MSPLAFIGRTPIAIQELDDYHDCFDRASSITPADLAAQKAAIKIPPIPKNFSDAMTPIRMLHTFARKLFGPHCQLGTALHTFEHHAAHIRHQVVGQDDILKFFLPQMYHFIIKDVRQFFTHTATITDVDLPPGTPLPNPRLACSKLEAATAQLLMLQDLRPLDMPASLVAPFKKDKDQQRRGHHHHPPPGVDADYQKALKTPRLTGNGLFPPPSKDGSSTPIPPGRDTKDLQRGGDRIVNPDQPPTFKNDPDLQRLLANNKNFRLNDVCKAAGFPKGWGDVASTAGIPRHLCAAFGVKGACVDRCIFGTRGHTPAAQWNPNACEKALQLLRPGIAAILAKAQQ